MELLNGYSIADSQSDNKKLEDYLQKIRKSFKKDSYGLDWIKSAFVDKFSLNSLEKTIRTLNLEEE